MVNCGTVWCVVVGAIFVAGFCTAGAMSIWVGVQSGKENIATTCTVVKQDVVSEDCAWGCRSCSDDAPGESCGCQYSPCIDYVTWAYVVNNRTYTTGSQICSDGGNVFVDGFVTTCWYNPYNPHNVQVISGPSVGWILTAFGIVYILIAISIIGCIIGCIRQNKKKETLMYEPV